MLELIRYQLREAYITAKYLHLSANISNVMKMFNQYQYVFENVSENQMIFNECNISVILNANLANIKNTLSLSIISLCI